MPILGASFSPFFASLHGLTQLRHSGLLHEQKNINLQHDTFKSLASEHVSGYVVLSEGFLVIHQGCWSWASFEGSHGLCAYQRVIEHTPTLSATFYPTTPELSQALLAMFLGKAEEKTTQTKNLVQELQEKRWTGCLSLWDSYHLVIAGEILTPLPEHKGNIRLLSFPTQLLPNLVKEYEDYVFYTSRAKLQSVWFRMEIILQEFVGNQSIEILSRLKELCPETDPVHLKEKLRHWIIQTLSPEALDMFDQP